MSTIRFEENVARSLVRLLATDDEFRLAFSVDPVTALQRQGLSPVEGYESMRLNGRCLLVDRLASKEAIEQAGTEIDRMLTSGISQIAPALDAGRTVNASLEAV
ncbi:NHLP-related RiPP peptide [Stenotrophomonas sp. HITSZ_GD]|uniref:NHLP-related RiPP peptide n=1 Tax=Stenotrophomonas sp. HITSZ_GD TaxID=3037248 RepID=UPI00240DAC7D|nr:NHLP-related RiPP peptide [Stenotrophomonas sp. HITSZ_GD]MDG2523885.1 NHLP-related RiPP peptide [Stenotrophomonas sp. HITSZ_GD]